MQPIDLSSPDITDAEIQAVAAVLRSGRLSLGPKVTEFESAVAAYVGTKHAVAVTNGTCGLHLLMRAVGVQPGDEVISTPFSFVASTNCAMFERAKPVLVDIDPETWNIDAARIEAAVTSKTRAIIPVDVFGVAPDLDEILKIAARHRLRVVEDSCEALGARYKGKMLGSFGDAGVFGFYPNKQITTGEGGMIVTNDDEIARLCQSMRNQGRDAGMGWLAHERLGHNYRLSDIACAIGAAQMRRIDEILAKRARVAAWYRERLADESRISMQRVPDDCEISWFVFVVKLADDYTEERRNSIIHALRDRGIGCSNYFAPIHLQRFYRDDFGYKQGDFPECERVAARTIALPFHGHLTASDVDRVCETMRTLL
ncbi:MAG: DegT/DnrJ/EryC1/StrS family aminotransferase [Phycisphaerae bacterium]|nr:DegT/DnrJ/EryC1/StrS family aminotransferase [Phycisphaerae bacterium]